MEGMLNFITSNQNKFNELKIILVNLKRVNLELPEIQEIDARKIIKHKLLETLKHHQGEYIVKDTSLYLGCFNYKLPSPLVKWFEKGIGNKAIVELTKKMRNNKAIVKTVIGYGNSGNQIHFLKAPLGV